MKKRIQKKLELNRETLRALAGISLREVVAGRPSGDTCPLICGSDANTVCFETCACTTSLC